MKRSCTFPCLLLLPLVAGCASTATDTRTGDPPASEPVLFEPSLPWTTAFVESAVLVAEEIHVEGPSGLLQHFAARVEEAYHERVEETVPEGYRQVFVQRPDGPLVELRGYLDRLELVATRRLTVLERPGEVDVVVEARGDVFYSCAESGQTERKAALRLVGRRPGS